LSPALPPAESRRSQTRSPESHLREATPFKNFNCGSFCPERVLAKRCVSFPHKEFKTKPPASHPPNWTSSRPVRKRSFFWSFPYVCPEPVLVKSSFIYINGSKRPFFHLVWEVVGTPRAREVDRAAVVARENYEQIVPHAPERHHALARSVDSFLGTVSQSIVLSGISPPLDRLREVENCLVRKVHHRMVPALQRHASEIIQTHWVVAPFSDFDRCGVEFLCSNGRR
jgi:hypothetical protein